MISYGSDYYRASKVARTSEVAASSKVNTSIDFSIKNVTSQNITSDDIFVSSAYSSTLTTPPSTLLSISSFGTISAPKDSFSPNLFYFPSS